MIGWQLVWVLFIFTAGMIASHEVVMPNLQDLPRKRIPFLSDIRVYESQQKRAREEQETKDIVEKVLHSDERELDQQANLLIQNQEKLSAFLNQLPASYKEATTSSDTDIDDMSPEERVIFTKIFKDPLLAEKITLSIDEGRLQDIVKLISKATGVTFLVDSSLQDIVLAGIDFHQTPLGDMLAALLGHLAQTTVLVRKGSVFSLLPLAKGKVHVRHLVHRLQKKHMTSAVFTLQYAGLHETLRFKLEALWEKISAGKKGPGFYFFCDEMSKKIFVRGYKSQVEAMSNLLTAIDMPMSQVKIDARVVLVCRDFERSWGLQWSHLFNRHDSVCNSFEFVGSGPLEDIQNHPKQQSKCSLFDWALNVFPATAAVNKTLSLPFVFGGSDLDTKRLNVILNAAENRGDVETLLKPTLLAAHKEPAEMLVGSRVPIETIVKESIEGSLRDISTATYIDVGTKLKIKPLISPDKQQVFLDIYVENSCLKGCSGKFPIIQTTRSRNRVVLNSGQTTLIGGLIERNIHKEHNALPVLGNIPFFGWLFKGVRRLKKESQLLIFLTPTIL